ncbi:MAG: PASTA domain-containing protein [Gammaproteobacteria bacterium]
MPKFDKPDQMLDAVSAPMGDLIAAVGESVAQAQQAMDRQTLDNFLSVQTSDEETMAALRQIGYQPTWYHIPEVNAEISVALTISGEASQSGGSSGSGKTNSNGNSSDKRGRTKLFGAPVDAGYSNRYNYDIKASSTLNFKIVPVPPSVQTEGMRIAPDLIGETLGNAKTLLSALEMEWELADDGIEADDALKIIATEPAAGQILLREQTLKLSLE